MAFAKLKALLRAAAARTIPDLWQAIADALCRFTPHECANYLAAAGYDATGAENALAVSSRYLLERANFESAGSEVQALQMNSYGVRPLRVLRRLAKL